MAQQVLRGSIKLALGRQWHHTQILEMQVLDQIVAPVLLAFATARDTQESQILNPLRLPEMDVQNQERLPHLSVPAALRGLQLLPKLQDWAIFGVLICPGTP